VELRRDSDGGWLEDVGKQNVGQEGNLQEGIHIWEPNFNRPTTVLLARQCSAAEIESKFAIRVAWESNKLAVLCWAQ
jgi:hypothetical protein